MLLASGLATASAKKTHFDSHGASYARCMDRSELVTLRQHPEASIPTAAAALTRGLKLGRRMTRSERLLVGVISAEPTHLVTVHSKDKSREEMAQLFRRLVKRINRSRGNARPLIYVATIAAAKGNSRHHVHALLWEYIHASTLGGYCREFGLGWPEIRQLSQEFPGDAEYWASVSYALTQHEPAFGTDHHQRHEPIPKFGRGLLYPHCSTLAEHCPQLLSALDQAKDPAVSDESLCSRLPRFSKSSSSP